MMYLCVQDRDYTLSLTRSVTIYIIVDVKGIDWNVELPDGSLAPIDKNDFSFVMNGERVEFDYAYITIHGQPGENGVMQGYFDLIQIPYSTGGVLVEALTFDKYVLNNYLRGLGIKVADSICFVVVKNMMRLRLKSDLACLAL